MFTYLEKDPHYVKKSDWGNTICYGFCLDDPEKKVVGQITVPKTPTHKISWTYHVFYRDWQMDDEALDSGEHRIEHVTATWFKRLLDETDRKVYHRDRLRSILNA